MHFSKPILLLTLLASSGIDAVMSKSSEDSAEKNIRHRATNQRYGSRSNGSREDAHDAIRKMASTANRYIIYGDTQDGEMQTMTALNDGQVVINIPGSKGMNKSLTVVEISDDAKVAGFVESIKAKGLMIEVDEPVFPDPIKPDTDTNDQHSRSLQEVTPWGIQKVFEDANGTPNIPSPADFPEDIAHRICIIDSGYQKNHPDLPNDATNADPSQGEGSRDPFSVDRCGHGSHVAGTIAAMDNDSHVIGVYPGAPQMLIVKVFSNNPSTNGCTWSYQSNLMAAAAQCRRAGAKIINMSLGSPSFSRTLNSFFQDLNDNDGILSIAAAGNAGNGSYSYPASYPSVMSVAATDSRDNRASFSQFNDQVDIAAPGVGIRSTVGSNSVATYQGTSMAAPHVAGVAFLLWNNFPQCSNADIREALQASATDRGSPGRDNAFGHGIVKYHAAESYLMSNKACARRGDNPCSSPIDMTIGNNQVLQINMKGSNKKMRIGTADGEFQVQYL